MSQRSAELGGAKAGNLAGLARQPLMAAMVEEATVDAYGDSEQTTGWYTMLEERLALPFEATRTGTMTPVRSNASPAPCSSLIVVSRE